MIIALKKLLPNLVLFDISNTQLVFRQQQQQQQQQQRQQIVFEQEKELYDNNNQKKKKKNKKTRKTKKRFFLMKENNNRKKIKQLFHWYPDSQKREQMIMQTVKRNYDILHEMYMITLIINNNQHKICYAGELILVIMIIISIVCIIIIINDKSTISKILPLPTC